MLRDIALKFCIENRLKRILKLDRNLFEGELQAAERILLWNFVLMDELIPSAILDSRILTFDNRRNLILQPL
ncbi:MAG TPA: hypothetical protein DCE71_02270 [Parachlamydiales bacterium]|nr:hypothetical protein [Parachlamydiales bacterium]